jgi:hypothetical protein
MKNIQYMFILMMIPEHIYETSEPLRYQAQKKTKSINS